MKSTGWSIHDATKRIEANRILNVDTGCLEWVGYTLNGYGQLSFKGKTWYVHRLVYYIANGSIPDNKHILHKCNNPLCSNIEHLYAGTVQQNIIDRSNHTAHRTSLLGNTNSSILKADEVKEIKTLLPTTHPKTIADLFKVNINTIRDIRDGRTWKNVWPHVKED